jgi:diguanylate cyclase (GGDEF)-like protein
MQSVKFSTIATAAKRWRFLQEKTLRIRMTDAAGTEVPGAEPILSAEPAVFLSALSADRGECLLAGAVIVASAAMFIALAPFAKMPLAPLPAFIPIYQSALVINDVVTVVFLLEQSRLSQSRALAFLAGGYLFTALMSIAHVMTFPGLFSPTGLLGAGPQTTAWLYMFWHGGFPFFVIGYAIYGSRDQASRPARGVVLGVVVLAAAAVVGSVLAATSGQHDLPAIMQGNRHTAAMNAVVWSVWVLNLFALFFVWRRKPYSVLDLWLIVVLFAWLFDIALSAALNSGRYDLGFYAGRIYGLLAASLVLIVLLRHNGRLYLQLIALHDSEREKADELRRLTVLDPLTGIANRRAFEATLDQEWRRMMRHGTALSLLMIDVDHFKRYNDTYGHVGGDQCLRAVAQALARRTRRAGELAARYGGEEFAVLLPHTDIAAAKKLGELICETVRGEKIPHAGSTTAPYVTVSVGAACMAEVPPAAGALSRDSTGAALAPGATVLVEAADGALYQAKVGGRNGVVAASGCDAAPAAKISAHGA